MTIHSNDDLYQHSKKCCTMKSLKVATMQNQAQSINYMRQLGWLKGCPWQAHSMTPPLAPSEPMLQTGTIQSEIMTKNSVVWCPPILQWPAPTGQPPEITQPQAPGSLINSNHQQHWQIDYQTDPSTKAVKHALNVANQATERWNVPTLNQASEQLPSGLKTVMSWDQNPLFYRSMKKRMSLRTFKFRAPEKSHSATGNLNCPNIIHGTTRQGRTLSSDDKDGKKKKKNRKKTPGMMEPCGHD